MAAVSFRTFEFSKDSALEDLVKDIRQYLFSHVGNPPPGKRRVSRVVVTIEDDRIRSGKKTTKAELESMAVDAALESKEVWRHGEYVFNFLFRKYTWKGKEIYVTANEALFLFRWLVADESIHREQFQHLRNARRRLGKEFLQELTREEPGSEA